MFCPNCGYNNQNEGVYCYQCGAKLPNITLENKVSFPSDEKQKSRMPRIPRIVLFIILLLIAAWIIFQVLPTSLPPTLGTPNYVPAQTPSKYTEIAHANFCVGLNQLATYDPPLVIDPNAWPRNCGGVMTPIDPGTYHITVTTNSPGAAVNVNVYYRKFEGNDKFGVPMHDSDHTIAAEGISNRLSDYNTDLTIPHNSIEGTIGIGVSPLFYNAINPPPPNCGTLIVTRLTQ